MPLTFADPATYDRSARTTASTCSACRRCPARTCSCQIVKPDGTTIDFEAVHTFSPEQVEWFKAGSALNIVRQKVAAGDADGHASSVSATRDIRL